MATKTYLFHEISSYLPLLEGEEFDALVEDIKKFGQIEPAILYEGTILDGRNRYRACKQLGIELKVKEWNPSEITGVTPLQFVISENIMRRHLNTAQKSEIGMLLYDEVAKKVEIGQREKQARVMKEKFEKGELKALGGKEGFVSVSPIEPIKTNEIKKDNWTSTDQEVADQVKVGKTTIRRARKIKEIAKEDKEIAEEWEKAKKGEQGVDAVYKKVKEKEFVKSLEETEPEVRKAIEDKIITSKEAKEIVKLPRELKEAVIKPKSKLTIKDAKEVAELPQEIINEVAKEKITVKEAKDIADIPTPEIRKEAIQHIKKEKKLHERTLDYIKDVATGKTEPPTKIIDIDQKIIKQFIDLKRQIIIKMSMRHIKSYNENTQVKLIRIMKELFEFLQKELKIKEVIKSD